MMLCDPCRYLCNRSTGHYSQQSQNLAVWYHTETGNKLLIGCESLEHSVSYHFVQNYVDISEYKFNQVI
jgi:hypothetical protein